MRTIVLLRALNVGVGAVDGRRIEAVASDLPCFHGAQLAVDITLRGVLGADGEPHASAASTDGVAANSARADKERVYPEIVQGRRCNLVVLGIETGGRWGDEAVDFLRTLAESKARGTTPLLRRAAERNWIRRWARVIATACTTAFVASLVDKESRADAHLLDGAAPCLESLFGEARC